MVALLELQFGVGRQMTFEGADPAFLRQHDGDRLAFHQRLGVDFQQRRGGADAGAAGAERAGAEFLLDLGDLGGDFCPALAVVFDERAQFFLFRREAFVLLADFLLLQPAQRPQPHVEDGFGLRVGQGEGPHQRRFRLVFGADDADHLVQVQKHREVAVEDFQPAGDGVQPVLRASQQNLVAVVEPGAQQVAQAHHARRAAGVQHVHVEGETVFQLGGAEQRRHQHVGIDAAGAGLQHQADGLSTFVADVGQERQFAFRRAAARSARPAGISAPGREFR